MFKKFLCLALSFTLLSCTSTQKFNQKLEEKNCEAALENLPSDNADYKLVSKAQEISGTVLSYSAIGAAYTVQVLWDTTATVAAVTILCAPTVIASVASSSTNQTAPNLFCLPGDVKKVQAPYLGKQTIKATEKWSCPDVDTISQSIRKVAQCYRDRGGDENRAKAQASLESVLESGDFYRCLTNQEKEQFSHDLTLTRGLQTRL